MKVYIDLIILINLLYDFLILTSTSILLKRNTSIKRIIFGTIFGLLSLITLFIPLTKYVLLIFKIILSILMILITFGFKGFKENIFYFYVITIIIGGSNYLISNEKINVLLLSIITPIILYLYIYNLKKYRLQYTKIHSVLIVDKGNIYNLTGYLDTGNNLVDPITKREVIMVNKNLNIKSDKKFLVPFNTLNNTSILECIKVDKVLIDNKEFNCLVGLADNNIFKNNIDVIINERMRERIC